MPIRLNNGRRISFLGLEDFDISSAVTTAETINKGAKEAGVKTSVGDDALKVGGAAATGAALGASVGSVVPVIGTAIGGVVGGVAGAIAGLSSVIDLDGTSDKQHRLDREVKRQNIDKERVEATADIRTDKQIYDAMLGGRVVFTQGVPGSMKANENAQYIFKNGKKTKVDRDWLVKNFGMKDKDHFKVYNNKIMLGSLKYSADFLKKSLEYENKAIVSQSGKSVTPKKSTKAAKVPVKASTKTTKTKPSEVIKKAAVVVKKISAKPLSSSTKKSLDTIVSILNDRKVKRLATIEHKTLVNEQDKFDKIYQKLVNIESRI